jgi:hypothetical protein
VDFTYLLFADQVGAALPGEPLTTPGGVRWIRLATDLPNAVRDLAAVDLRVRDYMRTLAAWTPKPSCRPGIRCRGSTSSHCCHISPCAGGCDERVSDVRVERTLCVLHYFRVPYEDVPSPVELRWRPDHHQAALTVSS